MNLAKLQTINVLKSKGKRYVIPDIHGCNSTFKSLLYQINLKKEDQLFLLGDYIGRGHGSVEVIDTIIELQEKAYHVYPIRGNHEEEILLLQKYGAKTLILNQIENENMDWFYNPDLSLKEKYLYFFKSLPYFIELEDFLMVHAGFDFFSPEPFKDINAMLEIRNWHYNSTLANDRIIVHGHSPHELTEIRKNIHNKKKILAIDNGCVYTNCHGMGNLICLNLDNYHIDIQPNIE